MAETWRRPHDPSAAYRSQSRPLQSTLRSSKKSPSLRQGITFPGPVKPARAKHHRAGSLASAPAGIDPHRLPPSSAALSTSLADSSANTPSSSVFPARNASLGGLTPTVEARPSEKKMKSKAKIKPILKKLSPPDDNSLDLGRSAMDDDGLGIHGTGMGPGSRSALEASVGAALVGRGPSHHRSTSGTSQFSTNTSASAGRPYIHPMRQTPRPYTPPIAHSYTTSFLGSDHSGDATDSAVHDDDFARRVPRDAANRAFSPYSCSHVSTPPLRLDTSHSVTQLSTDSPSNLAGTPSSFMRPRAGTLSPAGTTSPTSRSSVDMPWLPSRGEAFDSTGRAASIRAAREAFEEREAAKAEKAERERQRQVRKREKREEEHRVRRERKWSNATRPSTADVTSEKEDVRAPTTFPNFGPRELDSTGRLGTAHASHPPSRDSPGNHPSSSLKTTWIYFITWLKTRLLKIGRKMKVRS